MASPLSQMASFSILLSHIFEEMVRTNIATLPVTRSCSNFQRLFVRKLVRVHCFSMNVVMNKCFFS